MNIHYKLFSLLRDMKLLCIPAERTTVHRVLVQHSFPCIPRLGVTSAYNNPQQLCKNTFPVKLFRIKLKQCNFKQIRTVYQLIELTPPSL